MTDAFLIERAHTVASRLAKARCWHSGASFGGGTSTKWFDLNPADVEEAVIRLREFASAGEAGTAETGTGSVHEGAGPKDIAQKDQSND